MDQQHISDLIKYCPRCGRELENLMLAWGKACSGQCGIIAVDRIREDSPRVVIAMEFSTTV